MCSKVGSIVFSLPWSLLPCARAYVCETLTENPLNLHRLYSTQLDVRFFCGPAPPYEGLGANFVGQGLAPAAPTVTPPSRRRGKPKENTPAG